MTSDEVRSQLRDLPSVDSVVARIEGVPHAVAVAAARHAIDTARARLRRGESTDTAGVVSDAVALLETRNLNRTTPAINATGVLIHTNLGRAPLGPHQLDSVIAAAGYTTLELDRLSGRRGDRHEYVEHLLRVLTGAEAAVVVNNNAAAVLLALRAHCSGRDVIVSRGELVEIGGEFRIPDILEESGARLVEVGTTNRTHPADYEQAITSDTAAVLKVHTSNYRVVGFTASVDAGELARLAQRTGMLFLHDLGSGLIVRPDAWDEQTEPTIAEALGAGADIVTFSGDKLLAGPQSGIAVGRRELIDDMKRHPLFRAARIDKLSLAALEATLDAYASGQWADLPLWRSALVPAEEVERRAHALVGALGDEAGPGVSAEVVPSEAAAGGGARPGRDISSWAVRISSRSHTPDELRRRLLIAARPVVVTVRSDGIVVDLRTVPPEDDDELRAALTAALIVGSPPRSA
ncbi:MAG: L-seryl-tRNA(Sec) selenium transferase [Actinomycetota bacterium]|nr:L-seryl-tRNA(Sec) selenium transferase [Actinomycetota bacterium]